MPTFVALQSVEFRPTWRSCFEHKLWRWCGVKLYLPNNSSPFLYFSGLSEIYRLFLSRKNRMLTLCIRFFSTIYLSNISVYGGPWNTKRVWRWRTPPQLMVVLTPGSDREPWVRIWVVWPITVTFRQVFSTEGHTLIHHVILSYVTS